jgi:hypothetical protein
LRANAKSLHLGAAKIALEPRLALQPYYDTCDNQKLDEARSKSPIMSTTISILGGVGLFLLGMTVMTEG